MVRYTRYCVAAEGTPLPRRNPLIHRPAVASPFAAALLALDVTRPRLANGLSPPLAARPE